MGRIAPRYIVFRAAEAVYPQWRAARQAQSDASGSLGGISSVKFEIKLGSIMSPSIADCSRS
jgi:hypothetical protein